MGKEQKNKQHGFTIYLLKNGFNSENTLKDGHLLKHNDDAGSLPEDSKLFIMDSQPKEPWWKSYFDVKQPLEQVLKSAILFLPIENRYFAVTFGHSWQNLKPESYEYNFGLLVTLNCVDKDKLKSTDIVEPGTAKRQTIQLPTGSNLTMFEINNDSNIIKKLRGIVKEDLKTFFTHPSGADSIHISSSCLSDQLPDLCKKLLELYHKDDYKETFPDINSITPIREPEITDMLFRELMDSLREKDSRILLSAPEVINYDKICEFKFEGKKKSSTNNSYEDISIDNYYEWLNDNNIDLSALDHIDKLKEHKLLLVDQTTNHNVPYPIKRCLIYNTDIDSDGSVYHLCDGNWYKVESSYLKVIKSIIEPIFEDSELIDYTNNHKGEGEYNLDVSRQQPEYICLDKGNISIKGQSQIEPCDLYTVKDGQPVFCHVKKSTASSDLSHLFNQGFNSMQLLKSEPDVRVKFKELIRIKHNGNATDTKGFISPIEPLNTPIVIYAIITSKNKDQKSENLPLFSRISLMRTVKAFRLMGVSVKCVFVKSQIAKIK